MCAALSVWMNGFRVGVWTQTRGTSAFHYDPAWAESPDRRRLSLSLDFSPGNAPHRGAIVDHYFDNLLPDSDEIRQRLQTRFATPSRSTFDLLSAIGRDCVGAIQLLPDDTTPGNVQRIQAEPLTEAEVASVLTASLSAARFTAGADAGGDAFRISIAGAQEKTALLRHRDQWCRPLGPTPTTHIFKLPLGVVGNLQVNMQDSVENEWLCLKLLAAFGLETASAEIARFGDRKVLIVERFDRAWQGAKWIARRPQEDFCQALGVSGWKKYESQGGPGMKAILDALTFSREAARDRHTFVKAQVLFWMLAATDGHAKNFSLFHELGGGYRLTPLYDVLSAWPVIGPGKNELPWQKATLAMAVRSKNAHWKLKDIRSRHWATVAKSAGLADADALLHEIVTAVPSALAAVSKQLPRQFSPTLRDRIFTGLEQQAKLLAAG